MPRFAEIVAGYRKQMQKAVEEYAKLGDKGAALASAELRSPNDQRRLVAFRALRAANRDVLNLAIAPSRIALAKLEANDRGQPKTLIDDLPLFAITARAPAEPAPQGALLPKDSTDAAVFHLDRLLPCH